ncbi:MAG TPA: septum formation initiator family protein [Gaiellaceae bacterium]
MAVPRMTLRRWLAVGALVLVALLYYRPLSAYMNAKSQLSQRQAVVRRLEHEQASLKQRLGSSTSVATLAREARALGYVHKGEHLFIVKGIDEWRQRLRASLQPHGR